MSAPHINATTSISSKGQSRNSKPHIWQ